MISSLLIFLSFQIFLKLHWKFAVKKFASFNENVIRLKESLGSKEIYILSSQFPLYINVILLHHQLYTKLQKNISFFKHSIKIWDYCK